MWTTALDRPGMSLFAPTPTRAGERSVAALARYHVPDPAARTRQVPAPTWDEVDVAMEDRLPSRLTGIRPDVEPGHGRARMFDVCLQLID